MSLNNLCKYCGAEIQTSLVCSECFEKYSKTLITTDRSILVTPDKLNNSIFGNGEEDINRGIEQARKEPLDPEIVSQILKSDESSKPKTLEEISKMLGEDDDIDKGIEEASKKSFLSVRISDLNYSKIIPIHNRW